MEISNILHEINLLYEGFGFWSLALVLLTCLIMIPINLLYKKLMKKDCLQRLRKTLSALSVYIVAGIVVTLTTLIFHNNILTFAYVLSSAIPLGLLAQFLWTIIKFVRDYGVLPVIAKISQSKEFQNALLELGIDKRVVSLVTDQVKNIEYDTLDKFIENELEYTVKLQTELSGLVKVENLQQAVSLCINQIKNTLPDKKVTTETKTNEKSGD